MKLVIGLVLGLGTLGFAPRLLQSLTPWVMKMEFGKSFVLCSRFEGVLVDKDGQAAVGVRIDRTWQWGWNGKAGADSTVTDAQGRFVLPRVTGRSLTAGVLTHTPQIRQEIKAHGPAGTVVLWFHLKDNYVDNSELGGRRMKVVCRVDKEPSNEGLYWGTCVESKA